MTRKFFKKYKLAIQYSMKRVPWPILTITIVIYYVRSIQLGIQTVTFYKWARMLDLVNTFELHFGGNDHFQFSEVNRSCKYFYGDNFKDVENKLKNTNCYFHKYICCPPGIRLNHMSAIRIRVTANIIISVLLPKRTQHIGLRSWSTPRICN